MNTILFELRLALVKLRANRLKFVGKMAFFGLIFAIIFTSILFLAGSDQQMLRSIQLVKGEASCTALTREGEIADMSPVARAIEKDHAQQLKDVQVQYVSEVELNTDRSMIRSLCKGVEPDYFSYIEQAVSWRGHDPTALSRGEILLEASVADTLFAASGDVLTVKWSEPETGRANSIQLTVAGIFIGSKLLFKDQVFVTLEDMHELILEESAVNNAQLYFVSGNSETIRQILRKINGQWGEAVSIESVALDPTGGVFGVYKYYNLLLVFVLCALIVIFFIIMNYSNQNVFYMEYRRRRAELTTFLTYGMSAGSLRRVVAWEALMQTLASLVFASLLTLVLVLVVGLFEVTSVEYSDLITAIGGTRVIFGFRPGLMAGAVLAMVIIMVRSAIKGADHYLGREIRDILGTTE